MDYGARTEYLDPEQAAQYEADRFRSRLGRYRWRREQRAVGAMLEHASQASLILDVPCGVGRWVPALRRLRPDFIVEADVSPAMLAASRKRHVGESGLPFAQIDATALPFKDNAFDLVFCHALTKHLPTPVQAQVLRELGRVSRGYVICSFSVNTGLPVLMRKLRRRPDLSTGVSSGWLQEKAALAGLKVLMTKSCSTPIGLERSVLFEQDDSGVSVRRPTRP